MPSPFPGMDPYLEQEQCWHGFHQRFCTVAADFLVPQTRPNYIVEIDDHVYIHELPGEERRFLGRPDVSIRQTGASTTASSAASVAEAPFYTWIPTAVDVEHSSFLQIRDRQSRAVVTVIELLSPANKSPGSDREQYLAKRRAYLITGNISFIEIDLLRGGSRPPLEDLPQCDYYALVARPQERPRVGVWPIGLRDRLPVIPIPLRAPDPDARLDLQQVLDRVYDAAGYADYIYTGTPQPPLSPEDESWARELLGRDAAYE